MDGNISDASNITTGQRQGDAPSPLLLNLVLEQVARSVTEIKEGVLLRDADNLSTI